MSANTLAGRIRCHTRLAGWKRLSLTGIVCALLLGPDELRWLTLETLSDAYIAVSSFVAATLAVFYTLETYFRLDTEKLLARGRRFHVPFAAAMGALPGCGGAIIVMTQYVKGRIGFGSVVAVLTATMGDAAFLLLAREPATGVGIFLLGAVVGMISGYIVDAIHGPGFLKIEADTSDQDALPHDGATPPTRTTLPDKIWLAMIVPGFGLGLCNAFQYDIDAALATPLSAHPGIWFGAAGALLSLFLWCFEHLGTKSSSYSPLYSETDVTKRSTDRIGNKHLSVPKRLVMDTNFVTAWVIAAFLLYEVSVYALSIDLSVLLHSWAALTPLFAILIGFIPGCGPQILVTTVYLEGLIPLSAQLGNAISNDGDALFPAIALAPRAAVLATLYSGIPAFIVGYGTYLAGW